MVCRSMGLSMNYKNLNYEIETASDSTSESRKWLLYEL